MRELFRNSSPGALTRAQAVAQQKEKAAAYRRKAEELARLGRGEDTEIAHVARGELVIPEALQSPEVLALIRRAAAQNNIPFDRLRVGSARNSINPHTGVPEFDPYVVPGPVRDGITVKTTAIPGVTPHYRNLLTDDEKTDFAIAGLHPDIRRDATGFINTATDRMGFPVIIPLKDGGMRTFEEQDAIRARGSSKLSGGQSYHNYGFAFDVMPLTPDGKNYDMPEERWRQLGKIGNEFGLKWGGDFKHPREDLPHFERSYGYSAEDLREKLPNGGHLLNPGRPRN